MFTKRHFRTGFRALAATAIVAGAVMNLATSDPLERVSRGVVTTPV